jgi:hypothetical protein
MKYYSGTIWLLIITMFTACNKDNESDLYVKVSLPGGQHIEGAYVYTNPLTKDGITDEFGTVLLSGLEHKSYEVFAYLSNVGGGKTVVHLGSSELEEVEVTIVAGENSGPSPIINVLSPSSPAEFSEGDTILFSAQVQDNATLNENLSITWESSLDGVLNTSTPDISGITTFSTNTLSKGIHEITLTVEDTDGYQSMAAFQLSTIFPHPVILYTPTKSSGNVQLEWTRYEEDDFFKYEIFRRIGDCEDENFELIATIFDQDVVSFSDHISDIAYQACYFVRLLNTDYQRRNSNKEWIQFPSGHIFNFIPHDIFKHPTESIIYLHDKGARKLVKFDYASDEIVGETFLASTSGHGDIGDNGYGIEIYMPGDDGRVYILDADDLSLLTTIDTGIPVSSVVINGLGHVIANSDAENFWYHPLRVYSRSNGNEIDRGGDNAVVRLRKVPGQNSVISISRGISPIDMDYFEISDFGTIEVHQNDEYHGTYPLSPDIFRISDDGIYTVTSNRGVIYLANSSMEYRGQLYDGTLYYSDFAFNDDSSIIYAAASDEKLIQVVDYYTLLVSDEILTRGYPRLLVRDGNQLIVLNKPTLDEDDRSVAVEIIDL